jgi:hypothetical protein
VLEARCRGIAKTSKLEEAIQATSNLSSALAINNRLEGLLEYFQVLFDAEKL